MHNVAGNRVRAGMRLAEAEGDAQTRHWRLLAVCALATAWQQKGRGLVEQSGLDPGQTHNGPDFSLPKPPPSPPLLLAGNRHIVSQSPALFFLRARIAADW